MKPVIPKSLAHTKEFYDSIDIDDTINLFINTTMGQFSINQKIELTVKKQVKVLVTRIPFGFMFFQLLQMINSEHEPELKFEQRWVTRIARWYKRLETLNVTYRNGKWVENVNGLSGKTKH